MAKDRKSCVVSAAEMAALSDVTNLTNDRIEALTGGHGMLNVAMLAVANVIGEELQRGQSVKIAFANKRRLPVDDIMEKAIKAAKEAGADGANAALITACLMYLAGSAAQVGIPAGNRKLGAMARILAGVDRCGVSAIPTSKMNNKISAFPAVLAINQALMAGTLSPVNGRNVPQYAAGGCLFGHNALGEDHVWPAMAENGARIGVQAMLDAMAGASIRPQPFLAAVMGAAAILEIIHPDAEVPESEGSYGKTSSVYLVGKTAIKTAGLPEKLHMRITGQEFDTAQVVGDVGLILKDIGGPSVIGMMTFVEIFSVFSEKLCGASGGPHNAPIGHMTTYAVAVMKALADPDRDGPSICKALVEDRMAGSVNPESAMFCINTMVRKAAEVRNGPVTDILIQATEPIRAKLIHDAAEAAYDGLNNGATLKDVVKQLEDRRVKIVERYAGKFLSNNFNKQIKIEFSRIANGARRTAKLSQKYFSFDASIDIKVTVDGQTVVFEHFVDDMLPKIALNRLPDLAPFAPYAALPCSEIVLAGCCIVNVVVPAAVAVAMGKYALEDAAEEAERAAYISAGIPGGKAAAKKVAGMAADIINFSNFEYL